MNFHVFCTKITFDKQVFRYIQWEGILMQNVFITFAVFFGISDLNKKYIVVVV